jgi:hypothetical protein
MRTLILQMLMISVQATTTLCQQPMSLIEGNRNTGGWGFANGAEFLGARGELKVAVERFRDKPVLSLRGDFTKGGKYVQASVALPDIEIDTLSFWIKAPSGARQVTVRLVDGSEQCHQIRLRINEKGGWQQMVLPVEELFKTMGTPSAPDIAVQYEKWGGSNDGKWHQPGRMFVILCTENMGKEPTVLISDVLFHPSDEKTTLVNQQFRLDEMLRAGEIDWDFNLGQEFAGAKGGLDLLRNQPQAGENSMRLHADFTEGGAYVGVMKSFSELDVKAVESIHLKMRSETAKSFALRLVDGTGQCHQKKNMSLECDGRWHDVVVVPADMAGTEHWGGENDGKWHDSVQLIELMLNTSSDERKKPQLWITDIWADVVVEAKVKAAAFAEGFESGQLPAGWQTAGAVKIGDPSDGDRGKALLLERTLAKLKTETSARSRGFNVAPGTWQIQYRWKAKLHSPDNSYHGSVAMEVIDRTGALLEKIPVGIGYGRQDWQVSSKPVVLPVGASKARFRIQLEKTYGSFWLDELSASPLSIRPVEERIERILLATDVVGNLFLPGSAVVFNVKVEAAKPLSAEKQVMQYSVRDYWGAEQIQPVKVRLERTQDNGKPFVYWAEVRIPADRLVVGKYYELHVAIPQGTGEPVREYSGLAVLPPAASHKYEPEQIPFTIRNWDSRIGVYFDLADRIGLRLMGVWGGWSAGPPYRPHCPGIDRCKTLGAKWITGTPASSVERQGFAEYSEESLRQGMKNFLQEYANKGMAMIAMGNEPHGTGDKVIENVRAYKAIYETVKAFDPNIHVIGTSVEPNPEYFKAGYQNYLDSYDFHIYEHYTNVRRTIREYRALMKQYDAIKPIHSTELGLNSQGQTRYAVALEMMKKFTVFFAEGGATVSWFTIQYPDPDGKARGTFGDSHCVFDCKYNLYNPRLDAITYYNMINGIYDKKFIEEIQYSDGIQAYLFRNPIGKCLQILWLDDGRKDILIPLPSDRNVELVHVDGSRTKIRSTAEGISLSVSREPVLLLYQDADTGLAKKLGVSILQMEVPRDAICPGGTSKFVLKGPNLTAQLLRVSCPPLWTATLNKAAQDQIEYTIRAPDSTYAREGRIYVQLLAEGNVIGELTAPLRVAR